jgi:hypothetical protein
MEIFKKIFYSFKILFRSVIVGEVCVKETLVWVLFT